MSASRTTAWIVAFLLAAGAGLSRPAGGQSVETLGSSCTTAGGPQLSCTEAAVTAAAIQGYAGLLAGFGSEVAGSAGTLGHRIGRTPHVALTLRTGISHVGMPDLVDPNGPPSRKATFLIPTLQTSVAVGLFDGFRLLPTVGGFLSLDLLGNVSFLFLPSGEGFAGHATAYTVGARLGIFRESFTLPGVSVSISRRDVGLIRLNTSEAGAVPAAWVDPVVTSMRATIGKDLGGVGLLGGMGWDWYGGSARIRVNEPGVGSFQGSVGQLRQRRKLFFAGAAMNFLILQLSGELGWARGFGPVVGYEDAPFDPTAGTVFVSLAARLTI